MWDSVLYVSDYNDPVIWEGPPNAAVSVFNAGPDSIRLLAWTSPATWSDSANVNIGIRPGGSAAAAGSLIRLSVYDPGSHFAAAGVRYLNTNVPIRPLP
jgi:hypothetical protein